MNVLSKIKLEVLEEGNNYVKFRIAYQTEDLRNSRGTTLNILNIREDYTIKIKSANFPEARESTSTFFLRGNRPERDDTTLRCSKEFYNKIQKAVPIINDRKFLY